ncbi:MAG TPA: hypothetical protein VHZ27_09210 [Solirubrobacteraceae bacterium]|jgi:hypothetical protein|nr:hypothetical protein [Solirubrobacteraceae bacterium]
MIRKLFTGKLLAGVAFIAVLAVTGAAVAYFTGGSGSVTGSGTVGASSAMSVTTGTPTWSGSLTALYPGATNNTQFLPFTVTNNGNGHQSVTTIAASVPADASGNAKTAAGASITGCLAAWFTATVDSGNPALPSNLAPGGTYTGKVDLTMQDSGTNQNQCQNAAPAVTITAS